MKKIITWGIIAVTVLATVAFASNVERLTAYVAQFSIIVDGEEQTLENPAVVINNRTYVPLREVSEVLGMNVEWNEENQTVIINSEQDTNQLYRFEQDGLWGFRNNLGEVVIEPQFLNAHEFSEGLAFARISLEQAGYIDLTGTLVILLPDTAIAPQRFSEGFAPIVVRRFEQHEIEKIRQEIGGGSHIPGPTIFIDRTGRNAFGMEFLRAENFEGGYARVRLFDGREVYIDREGNIVER